MTNGRDHPVDVLLVDPNQEDVRLFMEALENEKISNRIHTVSNGTEALEYIHQRGEYTDVARPDIILIEFELPEMSGKDVLEELHEDDKLKGIPVIVLTGSDEAEHIAQSYKLHANAYVQKPVDTDEYLQTVRTLEKFWIEIVRLPENDEDDQLI